MPTVPFSDRRRAFRSLLERPAIIQHASVWDPVSARLAEAAGFEMGILGGSVASHVILGAPDLIVITLTEFAEQSRRITRASALPLVVDADHGYGNALNVARTVEELEAAGVAALTIEDTVLPRRHGGPEGELISIEEFDAKLRAAIAARSDPDLVIIGRTGALTRGLGIEEAAKRTEVAAKAGVDAVFVLSTAEKSQVEALRAVTSTPLMLNTMCAPADELAALGVRIVLQGHAAYYATLRNIAETYAALREGAAPALKDRVPSAEVQSTALADAAYKAAQRSFLGVE